MRDLPPEPHYCQCVLVYGDGSKDHCSGLVSPDSPFCPRCVERHPDYSRLSARIGVRVDVTVRARW